jgi:hypothetical protein
MGGALETACMHIPMSGRPGSSYRPRVPNSCLPLPRLSRANPRRLVSFIPDLDPLRLRCGSTTLDGYL